MAFAFFYACFKRARRLTNVKTHTVFAFDLVHNSSGCLCVNRLMNDLDVETSKNVCEPLGESFGVADNCLHTEHF